MATRRNPQAGNNRGKIQRRGESPRERYKRRRRKRYNPNRIRFAESRAPPLYKNTGGDESEAGKVNHVADESLADSETRGNKYNAEARITNDQVENDGENATHGECRYVYGDGENPRNWFYRYLTDQSLHIVASVIPSL